MAKYSKMIVLAISLLLMAACRPIKLPPIEHYTFDIDGREYPAATHTKAAQTSYSIFVNQPIAILGYNTTKIIYSTQSYELKAYSMQQWVTPPALMMGHLIIQQLRDGNYFQTVLSPPLSVFTDFRLESRLIQLQEDYLTPTSSQVNLVMWVGLVDAVSHRVIANQTFKVEMPATANAYSNVVATNHAAEMISHEIAGFVTTQVRKFAIKKTVTKENE